MANRTHIHRRLPDPLFLAIYGKETPIFTPKVGTRLLALTVVLFVKFFLDCFAWTSTFQFAELPWYWWITLGVFVFPVVELVFDRDVIVDDTEAKAKPAPRPAWMQKWYFAWLPRFSGRGKFVFRAFMVLFLSTVTAVPFELAVFSPRITNKIDADEKVKIDEIRTTAAKVENQKFDKQKDEAQMLVGVGNTKLVKSATTDLELYRTARQTQHDVLAAAVAAARKDASDEASGIRAGVYHPELHKAASTTAFKTAQADKMQKELEAFDAATTAEIARLTKVRDTVTNTGNEKMADKVADIELARETKLQEIATMAPDRLAAIYGGTYKQPRDFMARFDILEDLTKVRGSAPWLILWGCRSIMIALGLILLALKIWAPIEFKRYYSIGAQARAQQEDATAVVQSMAYDAVMYGTDEGVKEDYNRINELRLILVRAYLDLDQKFLTLCRPNTHNLCLTWEQIQSSAHEHWLGTNSGAEKLMKLLELEEEVRNRGVAVPAWQSEFGPDRRNNKTPWLIAKSTLTQEYHWVDPQARLDEVQAAKAWLQSFYMQFWSYLFDQHRELESEINRNPAIPLAELISARQFEYVSKINPWMAEVARCEQVIISAGHDVPAWPRGFNDPRGDLYDRFVKLNESELMRMGWKGPTA